MSGQAGWKLVDDTWTAVDTLIEDTLLDKDAALENCLRNSRGAGLPDIAVSASQGRFLQMLVELMAAKSVLEIGTLGGYSTIFLARGVGEGGTITTLECESEFAAVARQNIEGAGVSDRVEVLEGAALDILSNLTGPFDLTFIDADKVNNCAYVEHAVRLSRPGALIIVDNVVREGNILDPAPDDESAIGTRAVYDLIGTHPQLESTALQTVGSKGWDGMLLARVTK